MSARARIASMAALLVAVAAGWPSPAAAADPTPAEALARKVDLRFIETPLRDVADFLTDYVRVDVALDRNVDDQQRVTFQVQQVSLKSALKLILEPRGMTFVPEQDRILIRWKDGVRSPAEFGHQLTPEDVREGWIALFDGQTSFGWSGGQVVDQLLVGGRTSSSFGDYLLRANFLNPGSITLGGKRIDVERGVYLREVIGRGPIVLNGVLVRSLAIQPLGLKRLLNGRDLGDWKRIDRDTTPVDERPQWRVEEGVLRVTGGPGCLEYPRPYGDFILQATIRTRAKHANGGIFFRAVPGEFMNGYEAQIYNRMIDNNLDKPFKWSTGSIDDRQLARRVVSRDHQVFHMTVIANGPHIATWVNGHQLVDWTDTREPHDNARQGVRLAPGTIQLQAHDAETDIEFHAVNVAPLD